MEKSTKSSISKAKPMKLKQLCLTRSGHMLLKRIDLNLPSTGVTVLLGANGAGKSTLLNVIAGISDFDTGELELVENTRVCLMPEPAVFYPRLTVKDQLEFVASLYGRQVNDDQIEAVLERWQLADVSKQLTQHLSLGYRQRLSLAQLDVSEADLWLLDEPMNGMDPQILQEFRQQIHQLKFKKGIIMATHIMHEAQELADWVVVMDQGKVIHSAAYDRQIQFHDLYQQAMHAHHADAKVQ